MIEDLTSALEDDGFALQHATIAGLEVPVAVRKTSVRMEWWGTRLYVFLVVFDEPLCDGAHAERLTAAAQQYAIEHKPGLPRGLQNGTVTIPVFVNHASPAAVDWFAADPKHRFGALRFPVLADPTTGTLAYFHGRMSRGWAYGGYIRAIIERVVEPVLRANA